MGSALRFFHWHILRYAARHRLLALLNVASVALGVAVYLAIQIANASANRAFAATIDLVAGRADLQITRPGGLPEEILPLIARHPAVAAATPLVRGIAILPDLPGEYLQVLGLDVFTNEPFRTFDLSDFGRRDFDFTAWLARPDRIAVTEAFARRHGLREGDTLRAQINGADRSLRIGFLMRANEGAASDERFAALDLGWAQELFARNGALDQVQLRLRKGIEREAALTALKELLPPDAIVASPAQRSQQVANMLGGFQLNLSAMSLVSLLVGMFLIYNTVSASVVRRRHEIGILRSLGVRRREIRALFLGEALFLGGLGVLLGLGGGVLLAARLVGPVAETISQLYVRLSVQETVVTPAMLASASGLGLFSVLLAAWWPAATAARLDPVRALHQSSIIEQASAPSPRWLWLGLVSLVAAAALSLFALLTGPAWLGFGAAFFVLAGFSFLVPKTVLGFGAAMEWMTGRAAHPPLEVRLAAMNLVRALVRNAVTIAALAAAVAMAIGVSVMVYSFRQTVTSWIDQIFVADLFVAPAANQVVGGASFLPETVLEFFARHPAVAEVDTYRDFRVSMGEETVHLAVMRGTARRALRFLEGDDARRMERFLRGDGVIISESFARRHGLEEAEALELRTPDGPRHFAILGTFYDYTSDRGVIQMNARVFARIWKDERVHSLAVYLKPGASPDALAADFRARFNRAGHFMLLSNRELRARVFEIFDQTFAVTYVLRTIAVVVALVGITLSLSTLILERARELALFRALGGSLRQLRRLLLWESGMIGLLAALVGLASGLALALVLTGVINRAFFGWTIQLAFPWGSLAFTPAWIVAAALLAGFLPAWRVGRLNVAEALRSE